MKCGLLLALLAGSSISLAQGPALPAGSSVYIEPMNGYETYIAAAILKKHVPLMVVSDRSKASFVLTSNIRHQNMNSSQPSVVVNNRNNTVVDGNVQQGNSVADAMVSGFQQGAAERAALGETSVSIAVVNLSNSQVVFAHSVGKMGPKQIQKTAEDCAVHLKKFIEKGSGR